MSIRFKFRSSANFDALEIGNRDSISVAELRSRILHEKASQQQQQGFDLVFYDAVSGLECKADCEIPRGSSLIVKRVPGETMPAAVVPVETAKHAGLKESHNVNLTETGPTDGFDTIGADLCPMPEIDLPSFSQGFDQRNSMGITKDDVVVIPRGFNQHGNDMIILPVADEQMKSNKLHPSNFLTMQSSNLPLELKCSLCNNFFMDAVMIPCCQHSFCQKCIHQVLILKGVCPKCSSRRCTVGDLLPNLSLRQAIEHLLESQMFDTGFEGVMQKHVPDEESGIQVKDVKTLVQRELEAPQASSATGKGSNRVLMEALHEQQRKGNMRYGNLGSKANPHEKDEYFAQSTDFQGESQPVLLEAHGQADSSAKRKGKGWISSQGVERNFSGFGGYRKGSRNCYACGSPDHLMRDCPVSHQNLMFQPVLGSGAFHGGMPGYAPPYWNGFSFPLTPYANMYNNPSVMQYNPSMVPVSPFAIPPPYISSTDGNPPAPVGNMRTGYMPHPHFDQFGLQLCGNKRKKLSDENLDSYQLSDNKTRSSECYRQYTSQKTYHKSLKEELSLSRSGDSSAQRSRRKHQHETYNIHYDERYEKSHHSSGGREKRVSCLERSTSAKDDKSRSSEWHDGGRHKRHHGDLKREDERRRVNSDSDSSLGHHSTHRGVKRRAEYDVQDSHRNHQHIRSECAVDLRMPAEKRDQHTERYAGHDSSGFHAKHARGRHHNDRLQVGQEDRRDEHHRQLHRRAH